MSLHSLAGPERWTLRSSGRGSSASGWSLSRRNQGCGPDVTRHPLEPRGWNTDTKDLVLNDPQTLRSGMDGDYGDYHLRPTAAGRSGNIRLGMRTAHVEDYGWRPSSGDESLPYLAQAERVDLRDKSRFYGVKIELVRTERHFLYPAQSSARWCIQRLVGTRVDTTLPIDLTDATGL